MSSTPTPTVLELIEEEVAFQLREKEKLSSELNRLMSRQGNVMQEAIGEIHALKNENEGLQKVVTDLKSSVETSAARIWQLETKLKAKEDENSGLKVENEKLAEYKKKVELVQLIFSRPLNILPKKPHQTQTHIEIFEIQTKDEAAAGPSNGNGVPETGSESSTAKRKCIARGILEAKK